MPRGIMVVQSARPSDPEQEDEFNRWYSKVHIPELLEVPGFVGARRFKVHGDGEASHPYLAVYEIDADDVTAPVREYGARSAAGQTQTSDALPLDPPPIVTIYELIE